jgi:hypothetical protein
VPRMLQISGALLPLPFYVFVALNSVTGITQETDYSFG